MRPLIRRDAPVVVGTRSRRRVHVSPLTSRERCPLANNSKSPVRVASSTSTPSLETEEGLERGHPLRYVTGGEGGEQVRRGREHAPARRVARNFSNTACVFFSLAGGSPIGHWGDK